ncbi:MAG TPA: hypothetical protein VK845_04060 [Gemmatimonadales bacterium]|nr:hypothetical protein [Gemmatimonadales bacterium]
MTAPSLRSLPRESHDPVVFQLPPIRYDGQTIHLHLSIRRSDDGTWRGRMRFFRDEASPPRETAEIFRGASEQEMWESVNHLREHHLRDLFRSLG